MISKDDLGRARRYQKLTDKYIEEIAEVGKNKETEIMEV
jgi:ribosome recycling factor